MKKYVRYNLVADFGNTNENFDSYKEAFAAYQRSVKFGYPSTLYGFTFEGKINVILSSGGHN